MRIGIDVDDTTTDSWSMLLPRYVKVFNIPMDVLKTRTPYYYCLEDRVSIEEYYDKVKDINKEVISIVPLRKDADKYINKLMDDGNEIVFITSRGFNENYDPYGMTAEYMKKHNIRYTKLVINAKDKSKVALEEDIDLFIDDSLKHADMVSEKGIPVLLFETDYNKNDKLYRHVKSWKEIYDVIKGMNGNG